MKLYKPQNRRDFIKGSFKNGLKSLFGLTSILGGQKISSNKVDDCQENISCHNCYKMGICENEKAERTRFNVKRNGPSAKISKGAYYERT